MGTVMQGYRTAVRMARPAAQCRCFVVAGENRYQVFDGVEALSDLAGSRLDAWREADGYMGGATLPPVCTLVLAPLEAEILLHRLEAGGAIEDALCDTPPGMRRRWSRSVVARAVEQVTVALQEHRRVGVGAPVVAAVLEDCVSGSTYYANLDEDVAAGELTRAKAAAVRRAGESVRAKLGQVLGHVAPLFPEA